MEGHNRRLALPWGVVAVLVLLLLMLIATGWWRGTGANPQVQVPMFYDDHYIYPRPWTQEQEVPGIPDPAPVTTLYGANRISQPFIPGSDRLALIAVELSGPPGSTVQASLARDGTRAGKPAYRGNIVLDSAQRRTYYLTFSPIAMARGQRFRLTLAAPEATAAEPVTAYTVGGDRLGAAVHLNEYSLPGNLALHTYSRGFPGRWWLATLGEQLLPALFRLRLQQYKPEPFKGLAFPGLLLLTVLLSGVFLVAAAPGRRTLAKSAGWALVLLIAGFLLWQLASGRLLLPGVTDSVSLEPASEPLAHSPPAGTPRLARDLVLLLWTAGRQPEERFISTAVVDGYGAIRVPASSALHYPLTIPLDSNLRLGVVAAAEAEGAELHIRVRLGEQELHAQTVGSEITWIELDLAPWQGQATTLSLITEPLPGSPSAGEGLWLAPQLNTGASWLRAAPLPPDAGQLAGYTFENDSGAAVDLLAYSLEPAHPRPGQPVTVTLFWQAQKPAAAHATVFVHLLDAAGELVAQHDGQPVQNTYPIAAWQPDNVVADRHVLLLPETGAGDVQALAVGLYDPVTLQRWTVTAADGSRSRDHRARFPLTSGEGE